MGLGRHPPHQGPKRSRLGHTGSSTGTRTEPLEPSRTKCWKNREQPGAGPGPTKTRPGPSRTRPELSRIRPGPTPCPVMFSPQIRRFLALLAPDRGSWTLVGGLMVASALGTREPRPREGRTPLRGFGIRIGGFGYNWVGGRTRWGGCKANLRGQNPIWGRQDLT